MQKNLVNRVYIFEQKNILWQAENFEMIFVIEIFESLKENTEQAAKCCRSS